MKFKYIIFLAFLFLLINNDAVAQQDTIKLETYFHKNHFGLSLHQGFLKGNISNTTGPYKMQEPISFNTSLDLDYVINLSTGTGIKLTGGLGVNIVRWNFNPENSDLHAENSEVNPFLKTGIGLEQRFELNNKNFLSISAGTGFDHSFNMGSSLGYYMDMGDSTYHVLSYDSEWKGRSRPYLNGNIGINKILKNHDFLTFNIGYTYSFRTLYDGHYKILPETADRSEGNYAFDGSYISAGITYNFTKASKMIKVKQKYDSGEKINVSKKVKIDDWKNRPDNLYYITVLGGFQIHKNKVQNDAGGYIANANPISYVIGFQIKKDLPNKFFWETGISNLSYWDSYRIRVEDEKISTGGSSGFSALYLNAGGGFRVTNKNQKPLLSIEAGAAAGINPNAPKDKNDAIGKSSGGKKIGTFEFNYTSDDYEKSKIFPLVYAGISKDFNIRGNLYYTLMYRYYQGFIPAYESKMTYTTSETTGSSTADVIINGSSHHIQMGLKYGIGELWQKK